MSTTTTTTRTRNRRRPAVEMPDEQADVKDVSAETTKLVIDTYKANKKANSAKREYDGNRKKLLAAMQAEGLTVASVIGLVDGKPQTLEATISPPNIMLVDMKALRDLVDDDTWWKIISTSKSAIEKEVGSAVSARVCSTKTGDIKDGNVSVK